MNTTPNQKIVSNSVITTPQHLLKLRKNKPSYNFRAVAKVALLFFIIAGSAFGLQAQEVNMERYITLTVKNGANIRLALWADAYDTPVKIMSGSQTYDITVEANDWTRDTITASATTITIYGNIKRFDCASNDDKLTALDVSHNTELTTLWCSENQLSNLDVSKNTELKNLTCRENQLSTLDISQNTKLKELYCSFNQISTLDASKNTELEYLLCHMNQLSNLDVSQNTELEDLWCSDNQLSNLDVSQNTELIELWCYNNQLGTLDVSQNTELIELWCSDNQLINLDVSKNTELKELHCFHNQLSNLDVSHNTELTTLWCSNNQLSNLDVSQNTELKSLSCRENQLSNLDVSKNTKLEELWCSENQLSNLDVSQNTELEDFECPSNQLSNLDVSQNTELKYLWCSDNQLSNLDVSQNTKLEELHCFHNQLSNLDVSQNTKLAKIKCYNNPFTTCAINALFCSLPDRNALSLDTIWILDDISDANYDDVLASNKQNAIDKNWKVRQYNSHTDIPATTGTYECGGSRNEVNMERYITLTVENGADIRLDLKADADSTPIKIVSGNLDTTLIVDYNWTEFADYTAGADTMTIYGELFGIDCGDNGNKLKGLDASQNKELTKLYCYNNQIEGLDIRKNTELEVLACDNNKISLLDFSKNKKLKFIRCYNNPLILIDKTFCSLPNRETTDNAIIYIANNTEDYNITGILATNKQNAIDKNWNVWYFDNYSGALHNTEPETTGTYECIGEADMSRYITLNVKNGANIFLQLAANKPRTPVKIVSGENEYDIALWTSSSFDYYTAAADTMTIYGDIGLLVCSDNEAKITGLDISPNTELRHLRCNDNQINTLNASQNPKLKTLWCNNNQICNLDLSQSTELIELRCHNNQISYLDVSQSTKLIELWCFENQLSTLDVSQNKELKKLGCHNNQLSNLDVSQNTKLIKLTCGGNQISSLDVSKNTKLERFNCSTNQLSSLDVSKNTKLQIFWCYDNQLSSLDISKNTKLTDLVCNSNKISNLNISKNKKLKYIECNTNQISSLDVSKNTELKIIHCFENPFTTEAIDAIFCALPNRNSAWNGIIYIANNTEDANYGEVLATNKQNAIDKNWRVVYFDNGGDLYYTDITETTGDYQCPISTSEVYLSDLILYPNPVTAGFTIETQERGVLEIYSVTGQKVGSSQITNNKQSIDVSNLKSGIYFIRINGRVAKFVKR